MKISYGDCSEELNDCIFSFNLILEVLQLIQEIELTSEVPTGTGDGQYSTHASPLKRSLAFS